MGASAFVLRAMRTFLCAGALVILWALFTASEASASEASAEIVVRDSPGAVSELPSPAPAGFVLAVVPGAVEDAAQSASRPVAATQPQPSERAVTTPPSGAPSALAQHAKTIVSQQEPSSERVSRHGPAATIGLLSGAAGQTVDDALVGAGDATSSLGLGGLTEPAVGAVRPVATVAIGGTSEVITDIVETVLAATLPVLDTPLVPAPSPPDGDAIPELGPAAPLPPMSDEDAVRPSRSSVPVPEAAPQVSRSGLFDSAWVVAPVTDVQTTVAASPAVLQGVRSPAPASPRVPAWPAGPALGLSGSTAGAATSAQGGVAGDLPDTVSALGPLSALVGTTDALEPSNCKPLPGFRPE